MSISTSVARQSCTAVTFVDASSRFESGRRNDCFNNVLQLHDSETFSSSGLGDGWDPCPSPKVSTWPKALGLRRRRHDSVVAVETLGASGNESSSSCSSKLRLWV